MRFARAEWDTRLGPSDGALTADPVAEGVTFAPTFFEAGRWFRMADLSERYEGSWSVQFVHPVLVRCAIDYRPKQGQTGPSFRNEFTLTPDAILSVVTKTSGDAAQWGVTWPLLENDGAPLRRTDTAQIASVRFPRRADQQNFIALDARPGLTPEKLLGSTYGDLRPIRVTVNGEKNRTLIYPRGAGDPEAEAVRKSFVRSSDGFRSLLGRVAGDTYVGRSSAGGQGRQIDLNGDGRPDVRFSESCGFMIQFRGGKAIAIETDRAVQADVQGRKVTLARHTAVEL